jgi:type II secretory pathway component PulL
MVGRNGIFYDAKGRDWDATITKLVINPISVREAFWSPYKRLIRAIEEQLARRAAAADAAAGAKIDKAAETAANADKLAPAAATAAATAPAPEDAPKKLDVGTVAALGVAFGALSGALAAIVTGVARLAPWQIALIPVAILLVISGPSMFIAWLKLRQRTLGPILDAAGWAINGRVRINVPLGATLTAIATLPAGSQRALRDPCEDKAARRRKRRLVFLVMLVALAALGLCAWHDHAQTHAWFWERWW